MKGSDKDSIYHRFSENSYRDNRAKPTDARKKMPEYRQIPRPEKPERILHQKEDARRVTVHIAGMQYRLVANGQEGEDYIQEVAAQAEHYIKQVQASSPGLPMTSVTVLALVNGLDEMHQKENEIQDMKQQIDAFSEAQMKARENYTHLREINWELKKEVLRLQSLLEEYEKQAEDDTNGKNVKEMLPLEELIFDNVEAEDE
jgi:cell division protein ZapA (FtsZ GTPase activity inhibitor)